MFLVDIKYLLTRQIEKERIIDYETHMATVCHIEDLIVPHPESVVRGGHRNGAVP
jgi:hypothetical protein